MLSIYHSSPPHSAGNASSINDGAAAFVLMERAVAEERGLNPMATLVDYSVTGVEPGYVGIGPVSAGQEAIPKIGLSAEQIDVFEVNEAFAVQLLAVRRELNFPPERTNPNGSGISLGHPLGATGNAGHRTCHCNGTGGSAALR